MTWHFATHVDPRPHAMPSPVYCPWQEMVQNIVHTCMRAAHRLVPVPLRSALQLLGDVCATFAVRVHFFAHNGRCWNLGHPGWLSPCFTSIHCIGAEFFFNAHELVVLCIAV